MSSSGNADDLAVASALFDAIQRGDRDDLLAQVHDDVVWRPTPYSGGGVRRGRAEMGEWIDEYGSSFENLDFEVDSLEQVAEGKVLLLSWLRGGKGPQRFETELGFALTFHDGKLTEGNSYPDWQRAREDIRGS